jgi:hypothetical protein
MSLRSKKPRVPMGTVRTYGATRRSNVRSPTRQYIAASSLVSRGQSRVDGSIVPSPPSWEWRLRASARGPDPLYGIARPEPCGDLVFALEKGGVGLVARRSHGRVIIGISSSHRRVIGFGGQNYSQTTHFFSSVLQPGAGIGCNSLHTFDTCCTCVRASNTG